METEFGGNRKLVLILSRWRGEDSRLMPQDLRSPDPLRSLEAYIRQGLTVRSRWWGTRWWNLDFFLRCFKDSHEMAPVTQWLSLVVWWLCSLPSVVWLQGEECCRGKHQIGDVFSIESKEKMWTGAPAELGGRKANFSYRHAKLGTVKVNNNKKQCSRLRTDLLIVLVLGKGKEKNSFLCFCFSLQQFQDRQHQWNLGMC